MINGRFEIKGFFLNNRLLGTGGLLTGGGGDGKLGRGVEVCCNN